MATKIVDVFLSDQRVESYAIHWNLRASPTFDQDFVDRARECMRHDNYPASEIARARFAIRCD
jgi:hypothetical protein